MQLLRPVQPMLAESAADLEEALRDAGDPLVEQKLDGARIQVHKAGDDVHVFSRTLKEVTDAVPEVVAVARASPRRELVIDGEVIALQPSGTPHPFQITMRRFGRRLDVDRLRADLPLTPFFFDCLFVDGTSLLDEPLERRAAALSESLDGRAIVPRLVRPGAWRRPVFRAKRWPRGTKGSWSRRSKRRTRPAAGAPPGSRSNAPARSTWSHWPLSGKRTTPRMVEQFISARAMTSAADSSCLAKHSKD